MCDPVSLTLAATAATAGVSIYQGEKARKAQNTAADQARTAADRQFNAANPKKPNLAAISADNLQTAGAGVGSTMLTGAGGAKGVLGGTTLLGG